MFFGQTVTVGTVLIFMNEAETTVGGLRVHVYTDTFTNDPAETCGDLPAQGGVLNCDMTGNILKVRCMVSCESKLAINMIRVWPGL